MAATRTSGRPPQNDSTQTLTLGVAERSGGERQLLVRVVAGPDQGKFAAIGASSVVVGASTAADLPLTDPGVSRRHLEIASVAGGVRVVDLKSKNGTLLQGARLSVAVIDVGAELLLGSTTLRIEDAEELKDVVESATLGPLTTASTSMRRCFGLLGRAASSDVPIVLEGEAGTGKAVVARALHQASPRGSRAFIEFDASAVADDDVVAALFGAGGVFERAHNGTLFVEDIEGLALEVQSALGRVVDSGVLPSGKKVNVRVVAALSKDIDGEVRAGRMRAELRDALCVVRCLLPPLRDRLDDLPQLVESILTELGRDDDSRSVFADGWQRLKGHRWPGNIRELRQVLMRAVATAGPGPLQVSIEAPSVAPSLRNLREQSERDTLVELLQRHGGNVSAAARAAEVDRRTLHRLLKKHGLRGS